MESERATKGSPSLLWRKVNKGRWEGKNYDRPEDVITAAQDLKPRNNEEYISFFEVVDQEEGLRVAAAFRLVQDSRPEKIDFLIFPRTCMDECGFNVTDQPDKELPEFLSSRHRGARIVNEEDARRLAIRLLRDPECKPLRLREKEIEAYVSQLVSIDATFQSHLGEYWRGKLSEVPRAE